MNQKELNQVQSELQKGAAGLATETAKIQHDYIFVKEENQFVHITNCRTCEDKKEQKKAETNEAADSKKPYKLGWICFKKNNYRSTGKCEVEFELSWADEEVELDGEYPKFEMRKVLSCHEKKWYWVKNLTWGNFFFTTSYKEEEMRNDAYFQNFEGEKIQLKCVSMKSKKVYFEFPNEELKLVDYPR